MGKSALLQQQRGGGSKNTSVKVISEHTTQTQRLSWEEVELHIVNIPVWGS